MTDKIVKVGNIEVANHKPFTLFGGMKRAGKPRYGTESV